MLVRSISKSAGSTAQRRYLARRRQVSRRRARIAAGKPALSASLQRKRKLMPTLSGRSISIPTSGSSRWRTGTAGTSLRIGWLDDLRRSSATQTIRDPKILAAQSVSQFLGGPWALRQSRGYEPKWQTVSLRKGACQARRAPGAACKKICRGNRSQRRPWADIGVPRSATSAEIDVSRTLKPSRDDTARLACVALIGI